MQIWLFSSFLALHFFSIFSHLSLDLPSDPFLSNFVGKPKGKRTLGGRRYRWEDNIRMDLREVEWGGVDWIIVA
jgi:hypothetical protein